MRTAGTRVRGEALGTRELVVVGAVGVERVEDRQAVDDEVGELAVVAADVHHDRVDRRSAGALRVVASAVSCGGEVGGEGGGSGPGQPCRSPPALRWTMSHGRSTLLTACEQAGPICDPPQAKSSTSTRTSGKRSAISIAACGPGPWWSGGSAARRPASRVVLLGKTASRPANHESGDHQVSVKQGGGVNGAGCTRPPPGRRRTSACRACRATPRRRRTSRPAPRPRSAAGCPGRPRSREGRGGSKA